MKSKSFPRENQIFYRVHAKNDDIVVASGDTHKSRTVLNIFQPRLNHSKPIFVKFHDQIVYFCHLRLERSKGVKNIQSLISENVEKE